MSQQLQTALIRGVIGAVLAGALNFLIGLSQNEGYKTAAISAGIIFLQYLIQRGGVEGLIDTNAAQPPKAA
jgi:hypothetical protein